MSKEDNHWSCQKSSISSNPIDVKESLQEGLQESFLHIHTGFFITISFTMPVATDYIITSLCYDCLVYILASDSLTLLANYSSGYNLGSWKGEHVHSHVTRKKRFKAFSDLGLHECSHVTRGNSLLRFSRVGWHECEHVSYLDTVSMKKAVPRPFKFKVFNVDAWQHNAKGNGRNW